MGLPNEIHPFALAGGSNQYQIANSLRFRASASAFLSRTPTTASNQQKWTWSGWVKKCKNDAYQMLLVAGSGSTNYCNLYFDQTADRIEYYNLNGGSNSGYFLTTGISYRDPSAWYHIILAVDTTASAGSRAKLYVNGLQVNWTVSADMALNYNTWVNSANLHQIGKDVTGASQFLDGYMAEVYLIDGQALTPSSFGAFDTNSVWQPKKYTGTYGTNGFYLPFNTPVTSSFSGSFNGSNQYLTTSTNTGLSFGTSDFTVEYWLNVTGITNGTNIISGGDGAASSYNPLFGYIASSSLVYFISSNGGSWDIASSRTLISTITAGQWYHVAITRSGSTFRAFINGTQVDTFTSASSIYQNTNQFTVGRGQLGAGYFNGLLSNVRVIKGTALYTTNFTPSAQPLTAITNTQLLTLQNATIIDNSTNALTFTNGGTVTTSAATPWTNYIAGQDSSGNGNGWASSGITVAASANTISYTHDSYIDSPTSYNDGGNGRGNYPTLNPLNVYSSSHQPLNAGLSYYIAGAGWVTALSTFTVSTGKWYMESTPILIGGSFTFIGIAAAGKNLISNNYYIGIDSTSWGWLSTVYYTNNATTAAPSYATNDVLQLAFDVDNNKLWFGKNNTWNTGDPGSGATPTFTVTSGLSYQIGVSVYGGSYMHVNFGQRPFAYTPPTGFLALNTYNLANPSLPLV